MSSPLNAAAVRSNSAAQSPSKISPASSTNKEVGTGPIATSSSPASEEGGANFWTNTVDPAEGDLKWVQYTTAASSIEGGSMKSVHSPPTAVIPPAAAADATATRATTLPQPPTSDSSAQPQPQQPPQQSNILPPGAAVLCQVGSTPSGAPLFVALSPEQMQHIAQISSSTGGVVDAASIVALAGLEKQQLSATVKGNSGGSNIPSGNIVLSSDQHQSGGGGIAAYPPPPTTVPVPTPQSLLQPLFTTTTGGTPSNVTPILQSAPLPQQQQGFNTTPNQARVGMSPSTQVTMMRPPGLSVPIPVPVATIQAKAAIGVCRGGPKGAPRPAAVAGHAVPAPSPIGAATNTSEGGKRSHKRASAADAAKQQLQQLQQQMQMQQLTSDNQHGGGGGAARIILVPVPVPVGSYHQLQQPPGPPSATPTGGSGRFSSGGRKAFEGHTPIPLTAPAVHNAHAQHRNARTTAVPPPPMSVVVAGRPVLGEGVAAHSPKGGPSSSSSQGQLPKYQSSREDDPAAEQRMWAAHQHLFHGNQPTLGEVHPPQQPKQQHSSSSSGSLQPTPTVAQGSTTDKTVTTTAAGVQPPQHPKSTTSPQIKTPTPGVGVGGNNPNQQMLFQQLAQSNPKASLMSMAEVVDDTTIDEKLQKWARRSELEDRLLGKKTEAVTPVAAAATPSTPQAWKMKPCKTWRDTGTCKYGDQCVFAHISAST